jgi:hypothetical protein
MYEAITHQVKVTVEPTFDRKACLGGRAQHRQTEGTDCGDVVSWTMLATFEQTQRLHTEHVKQLKLELSILAVMIAKIAIGEIEMRSTAWWASGEQVDERLASASAVCARRGVIALAAERDDGAGPSSDAA